MISVDEQPKKLKEKMVMMIEEKELYLNGVSTVMGVLEDYLEMLDKEQIPTKQKLYFYCRSIWNEKRDKNILVDGYMSKSMWEDLGKIDALAEILQYIDAEKATSEKEYIINYLQNVYGRLIESVHFSSLSNGQQDKYICLYTKLIKMYLTNHDELYLKKINVLRSIGVVCLEKSKGEIQ